MNKFDFKKNLKHTGLTIAEVAEVGVSMMLTKKFFDFKTLFKNQIAKNPDYEKKFFIVHQGGIKLAIGAFAASMVKNPWLKLLFIGFAAEGFITEVRTLTSKEDGTNFFDAIGRKRTGAMNELDTKLEALATKYNNSMNGNVTDSYNQGIAGANVTSEYNQGIAGVVDLTESIQSYNRSMNGRETVIEFR